MARTYEDVIGAARGHLLGWCSYTDSAYRTARHIQRLAEELMWVEATPGARLMVMMPPRSGKSLTTTIKFPSWYLGRNPEHRIILASYSASLALSFSRQVRNDFGQYAPDVFGLNVSPDSKAKDAWDIKNHKGGVVAAGVEGSLTGKGADCLPAGSMVETEIGFVDIEELFHLESRPRVLSYNHRTRTHEYRRIIAAKRSYTEELVEIHTDSGRKIRATGRHRIYISGQGYRAAQDIIPGQQLVCRKVEDEPILQLLRNREARSRFALPGVLYENASCWCQSVVQFLQRKCRYASLRVLKEIKKTCQAYLLQPCVHGAGAGFDQASFLRDLQKTNTEHGNEVLLPGMPSSCLAEATCGQGMLKLPCAILSQDVQTVDMQQGMRKSTSLQANDGGRECQLQRWARRIYQWIQKNPAPNILAGRKSLFGLRGVLSEDRCDHSKSTSREGDVNYSSYRRGQREQQSAEPNNIVSALSHDTSQVESDTVSMVRRVRTSRLPVYDIQVEGNENFYCNAVRLHNCLLVDDPHKDAAEANSALIRGKVWDWYRSVARTRVHPGGRIVVIMTRWSEADLIGMILKENPDGWRVLNLPAIAEANDPLGRSPGEALWPERYSSEDLEAIRKDIGSYAFEALYQQRPSPPEGALVKKQYLRYYTELPEKFDKMIQTWDLAVEATDTSSYVVGQVWGRIGPKRYFVDQFRNRVDIIGSMAAIKHMRRKWPKARTVYIERKANGAPVIQMLKREMDCILPFDPKGKSKEHRLNATLPLLEAGDIFLPDPAIAPWVNDFVHEMVTFPYGQNDDQVDCFSMAQDRFSLGGAVSQYDLRLSVGDRPPLFMGTEAND